MTVKDIERGCMTDETFKDIETLESDLWRPRSWQRRSRRTSRSWGYEEAEPEDYGYEHH
jgi:hypothetical protein